MGRLFDKHIDSRELEAFVSSYSTSGDNRDGLSPDFIREVTRHLESCGDCKSKVLKYRELVNGASNVAGQGLASRGADCPRDKDVDWHEVAAGLWPESKAAQLIRHAALCGHCGPLLRTATSVDDEPTPEEEQFLAKLKAPSRPVTQVKTLPVSPNPSALWRRLRWSVFAPVTAVVLIVAVISTIPRSSKPLSGAEYARFAVNTHKAYAQGSFALDVRATSRQTLNEWFKTNSKLALVLPGSFEVPGEQQPYRLDGARLLQVGGKTVAYIAYQMESGPVSLMVAPDSVAVATGGVEVNFKRVSFHYGMVGGYKVVTWSLHGLTYALASQEGNSTQQSCMVCHSAMRDRDLTHTPAPLHIDRSSFESILQ